MSAAGRLFRRPAARQGGIIRHKPTRTAEGLLTLSLAAVFLVKIRACRVKNARKVSNLAALFSLHPQIFPQKTASQADCQQPQVRVFRRCRVSVFRRPFCLRP